MATSLITTYTVRSAVVFAAAVAGAIAAVAGVPAVIAAAAAVGTAAAVASAVAARAAPVKYEGEKSVRSFFKFAKGKGFDSDY